SYGIPLIADVYVEAFIGGGLSFFVDLSAGFDTSGLRKGASHFLEGLWIGDFTPDPATRQITSSSKERTELGFSAEIHAGIDAGVRVLGLPLAHMTGQGGIRADIGVDLNDDNEIDDQGTPAPGDNRTNAERHDGKFHVGEIGTVIRSNGGNPLCMFDLVGGLFAELQVSIEVNLFLFSFDWSWKNEWKLLDFSGGCKPDPIIADLANLSGTTLVLTSTNSADEADHNTRSGTNVADG